MVFDAASQLAATRYQCRASIGLPTDRLTVLPLPSPSVSVIEPASSMPKMKPPFLALHFESNAWAPFSGVVGQIMACTVKLSSRSISGRLAKDT